VDASTTEADAAKRFAEEDPEAAGDFPHLTRGNRDASTLEESDIEVATVSSRTASIRATDGHGVITDAARPTASPRKTAAPTKAATSTTQPVGTSINQGQRPVSKTPGPRPVASQRVAAEANRTAAATAQADRKSRVTIGSTDGGTVGRAKTPLSHEAVLT